MLPLPVHRPASVCSTLAASRLHVVMFLPHAATASLATAVVALALMGSFAATAAAAAIVGDSPAFPSFAAFGGRPYTVAYDKRALTLNGGHALFLSGAVHPPRGSPAMWDGWLQRAVDNGLNMVQVYIFW